MITFVRPELDDDSILQMRYVYNICYVSKMYTHKLYQLSEFIFSPIQPNNPILTQRYICRQKCNFMVVNCDIHAKRVMLDFVQNIGIHLKKQSGCVGVNKLR